jgi:hypothetical protein
MAKAHACELIRILKELEKPESTYDPITQTVKMKNEEGGRNACSVR